MTEREHWCSESFIGAGWFRHLPDRALLIVNALVARGPSALDALERELRRIPGLESGWQSAAWEPAHPWTDAELDTLRREVPDYTERVSAAEVIAQEAAARAARVSELELHAAHFGVPTPTTMGRTVDFLVACDLLAPTWSPRPGPGTAAACAGPAAQRRGGGPGGEDAFAAGPATCGTGTPERRLTVRKGPTP